MPDTKALIEDLIADLTVGQAQVCPVVRMADYWYSERLGALLLGEMLAENLSTKGK